MNTPLEIILENLEIGDFASSVIMKHFEDALREQKEKVIKWIDENSGIVSGDIDYGELLKFITNL